MKLILSVILTFLSLSIMGNNKASKFDYSSKWSEIDKLMDKPLLKDAQKKVDEIRATAKKENDELNLLKCEIYDFAIDLGCEYDISAGEKSTINDEVSDYNSNVLPIHRLRTKPRITNREEGEDIIIDHYKKASELKDAFKSPVEKACCELFMAKMVKDFIDVMERYPGAVSTVKNESGKQFTAEDFREMSFENLRDVVRNHVDNIVKSKETLISTSSEKYYSLFVKNDAIADEYKDVHPSVFDAMLPSLISFYFNDLSNIEFTKSIFLPIFRVPKELLKKDFLNSVFADVINYHNSKKEYSAALSAELSRLQSLSLHWSRMQNKENLEALDDLIKQYDGKTSYIVNAVVKKQEIMCSALERQNSGYNSPDDLKNIESFPTLIINEAEKYKKEYPKHPGTKELDKNINWLKNVEVHGSAKRACFGKGKDVEINVSYANTDLLYAEIYRVEMTPIEIEKNKDREESVKTKLIAKKEFKLSPSNYIFKKDTVINIGNDLDYGKYLIYFSDKKNEINKDNYITINISDLSLFDVTSIGDKRAIFVVDGETGHPAKGAAVERYLVHGNDYNLKETQNSSADGKVTFTLSDNHNHEIHAQKGEDIYTQWMSIYKNESAVEKENHSISILTDRNIYRPGQTIEGKVVLTYLSKNEEHVVENKKIKLILKDANYEKIEEKYVVTNGFGSAAFKFNIPTDRLNGSFSINAICIDNGESIRIYETHHITVESYKLPVAEAKINVKDGSSIMYGSKLEFEGEIKTFSGESVGGATVKYRIENVKSGYSDTRKVLFSGEAKCGDDGKFTIVTDSAITKDVTKAVEITVDAVLPSGETVSANNHVDLADLSVKGVLCNFINYNIEKHSPLAFCYDILNAAKYNSDAEVMLTITTKGDKDKNISSQTLISKKIKGKGSMTEESLDLSSLAPASYELHLETLSGEVIDWQEFLLYDKTSSKLPEGFESKLWIPCLDGRRQECSREKDAEILIGSSEKDAAVLAIVRSEDGKLIHDEWIKINNEQKIYKVPFNKYFANSNLNMVSVEFVTVRQHELIKEHSNVNIERKVTKEEQKIEILEIVRNIVPGEKQKVKMRVKPTNSNYEVAAVMVDASLRGMLPSWSTLGHYSIYYPEYKTASRYNYLRPFDIRKGVHMGSYQGLPSIRFLWDNINMPNVSIMYAYTNGVPVVCPSIKASPKMLRSMDMADGIIEDNVRIESDAVKNEVAVADHEEELYRSIDNQSKNKFADVRVRNNFVETAFFYPQLETKADGSVEFEYTAPDALTSWKMILFAHDKKVNSCITSDELQTKMPFAIKASLPRFVRKGDKCTFATTITNNEEEEAHHGMKTSWTNLKEGEVSIIIKDVATEKVLLQQTRPFQVAGQTSKVEEWSFDVPAGVAAIEVKMVGKSGTFSDGEVHQLPVLADGTHVVKSKSMHVRGGEKKDFSIPYNEKEMKDAELTVEYTDNAVWQALMALPSVKDAKYDCATELITTVYVNQMAQHIANIYPEIPSVVEEWKKEGIHATSPLEQNQELKNVLMQQTPWMCEAKDESEQRAKIVELYDKDRIAKANNDAISKLQKLQHADGGFAWFSDFKPSEYVTVYVAKYLVDMREYGVLPKECEKMLKNAVKYIDNALAEAYKNEIEKKLIADREWIFDIFKMRISYDKNLDNNTKKILDYYVNKAHKEIKEMTLYGKASFAIVLNMKGDVKEAKSIVESLRQSATETEEFGMYWKENQNSWGRYGNSISTHAMLTKAFQKTGCDAKELADLRFHLITKKETTQWSNTQGTLAAIDALVGDGKATSDLRKSGNRTVATIKIGGKQIDEKRLSGDGYVKIHYGKENFTPELCNSIHIEQPAGQEGIGGIYIAYDAPYSEITSGKSGIEVKKKMYKVVIGNDGDDNKEMLQEIKDGEKLKKGDKVKIVMTLRSNRDIDFVQVLDLRAACLEPVRKHPGMEWADGRFYYQSITDSEYSMFFDHISKGTRVFEYTLHVTQSGEYTQGITKVIPHYCPAFSANSEGGKVRVE